MAELRGRHVSLIVVVAVFAGVATASPVWRGDEGAWCLCRAKC